MLKKSGDEWRLTEADRRRRRRYGGEEPGQRHRRVRGEEGTHRRVVRSLPVRPRQAVGHRHGEAQGPASCPASRSARTPRSASRPISQRADDKKILLTSSAFHSGMDKQVKDLRDKTIVELRRRRRPEGRAVGRRTSRSRMAHKDDTWTIEQPRALSGGWRDGAQLPVDIALDARHRLSRRPAQRRSARTGSTTRA